MKKTFENGRLIGYATSLCLRDFGGHAYELMNEWRKEEPFIRITKALNDGIIPQPAEWANKPKFEGYHDWLILDAMARLYYWWMRFENIDFVIECYEDTFDDIDTNNGKFWVDAVNIISDIIDEQTKLSLIDKALISALEDSIVSKLEDEGVELFSADKFSAIVN